MVRDNNNIRKNKIKAKPKSKKSKTKTKRKAKPNPEAEFEHYDFEDDLPKVNPNKIGIQYFIDAVEQTGSQFMDYRKVPRKLIALVAQSIRDEPVEMPEESEELRQTLVMLASDTIEQYESNVSRYKYVSEMLPSEMSTAGEHIRETRDYLDDLKIIVKELDENKINLFTYMKKRGGIQRKVYMRIVYKLRRGLVKERAHAYYINSKGLQRKTLDSYKVHIPHYNFIEPSTVYTVAGAIKYPSPKQLKDALKVPIMAIRLKHITSPDTDFSSMVSILVSSANDNHVIASSEKCRILDFNTTPLDDEEIEKSIHNAIKKLVVTVDGYSYVGEIKTMGVYVTVTAFDFKGIERWFPNMQKDLEANTLTEKNTIWKIKDATIYLAFEPRVNKSGKRTRRRKDCIQLCVEYLGGKWEPNSDKTFEEMIPQSHVVTYFPKTGNIRDVTYFSDLVSSSKTLSPEELMTTTDCKQIARVIKFNGHMGLIIAIQGHKETVNKYQSHRPVKAVNFDETKTNESDTDNDKNKNQNVKSTDYHEIFLDIEAYQDKPDDPSVSVYYQRPYLICWSNALHGVPMKIYANTKEKLDDVDYIVGSNCCEKFIDHILETYRNTTVVLYAWYGSGYDYHHILVPLIRKCSSSKYVLKANSIMSAKLKFDDIGLTVITKDPFLFVLTSLHRAAKAFNVTNKSDFPHNAVTCMEDLDKTLDHWYKMKTEVIETYPEYANTNMIVTRKITNEYEKEKNTKTTLEHAIEYCKYDVIAMKEIWLKFQSLLNKTFKIQVNLETFTLSQMSMKLLEASLPRSVRLYIPPIETYNFMKDAIYGGRVIAINGNYKEDMLYADVVSLYPSAMKLLEHGYGQPVVVDEINWDKHGIYYVELTHECDEEPENYMPFVPNRSDTGKLQWKWFKTHKAVYHTYDLLIAKESGYSIKCISGYEFNKKGYILDTFVSTLFSLKNDHSSCTCEEQPCPIRMIAKIALNGGGYGKFVQRPILKTTHIVQRDVVAALYDECEKDEDGKITVGKTKINPPSFYNLDGDEYDKMVIEQDDVPRYSTACGISILSGSRYRLFTLCKSFPNMKVVYSDTDSIFVKASSVDPKMFAKACGTDLGTLDNTIEGSKDNRIHKMIVLGPKMYAYQYYNSKGEEKTTFHAKGVPTSMLSWEQYEHMIEAVGNRTVYSFETINKKLTAILTRDTQKTIKQT